MCDHAERQSIWLVGDQCIMRFDMHETLGQSFKPLEDLSAAKFWLEFSVWQSYLLRL